MRTDIHNLKAVISTGFSLQLHCWTKETCCSDEMFLDTKSHLMVIICVLILCANI